jgi:hypothetical protein
LAQKLARNSSNFVEDPPFAARPTVCAPLKFLEAMMNQKEAVGTIRLGALLEGFRVTRDSVNLALNLEARGLVSDPWRVEEVVQALVEYSYSISPRGARIDVTTRDLEVNAIDVSNGPWVEVVVRDQSTGGPMEAQARARIASRLLASQRAHSPSDPRRGHIDISKSPGGTTVRIVLPCAPNGRPSRPPTR